jgi:hypothetical protein
VTTPDLNARPNACPRCGGETEQEIVDVGPGEIPCGPRGCPACHWVEPELDAVMTTPDLLTLIRATVDAQCANSAPGKVLASHDAAALIQLADRIARNVAQLVVGLADAREAA